VAALALCENSQGEIFNPEALRKMYAKSQSGVGVGAPVSCSLAATVARAHKGATIAAASIIGNARQPAGGRRLSSSPLTCHSVRCRYGLAHFLCACDLVEFGGGDPRRSGEKISTVAYDCGFGDVSYFNRMFRRSYGATPSDIRALARQAAHGKPAALGGHHVGPAVYARHEFLAG
jgi:AraC-like DNA-binding protein